MRHRKDDMIISRGKELCGQGFYPLLFFKPATIRTMPVTTAMVLPVKMAATGIVAQVVVHAHIGRVTAVELMEDVPAYCIELRYTCMVKQLLKVRSGNSCRTHGCLVAVCDASFMASKGEQIAARFRVCKCK